MTIFVYYKRERLCRNEDFESNRYQSKKHRKKELLT